MINRRTLLKGIGAGALAIQAAPITAAFAALPTESRTIFIVLRGGLDGLHTVAPFADSSYRRQRPKLALPSPGTSGGVISLDGYWGLHPALGSLMPHWKKGELAIMQAATTSYRARSHFDGQNVLENGTEIPFGAKDGWLNRALGTLGGETRFGLALGHTVPLILRGNTPVRTWAPSRLPKAEDNLLERLAAIYDQDPLFKAAFNEALDSAEMTKGMEMGGKGGGRRQKMKSIASAAGQLLSQSDGPRVAVIETNGWDTHVGQLNRLNRLFGDLSEGLSALSGSLETVWDKTAIVVVSEFGRTVAENGTGGTDHGTGGVAILLGGAVQGGKMIGKWSGLEKSALLNERDVMPLNDYRSMFKGLLHDQLGIVEGRLEDQIFPNSRNAPAMSGMIKSA